MKKLIILISIIVSVIVFSIVIYGISTSNTEIKLRNKGMAQYDVCKATFDNMWKILKEQAHLKDEYKNDFLAVYEPLIKGRYSDSTGKVVLMKWIQEHNPQFDISLYKNLSASIESERHGFLNQQKMLIDIDREHKTLRQTFPEKLFIGSRKDLEIKIITSDRTQEIFDSGKENDYELFKK